MTLYCIISFLLGIIFTIAMLVVIADLANRKQRKMTLELLNLMKDIESKEVTKDGTDRN